MKLLLPLSAVLFSSFFLSTSFTAAQSCGGFIYTYDYGDGNGPVEEREPIEDCSNPFGRTDEPKATSVGIAIDGQSLQNDAVIIVEALPATLTIERNPEPDNYEVFSSLVRHEDTDYRYLTESVGSAFAFTATGTYSLITQVQEPFSFSAAEPTFRQKIQQLFLPVAHAQIIIAPISETFVTTFTIALEQPPKPKPPGASSVLFLPGIMGSRLYETGQQCGDFGVEQERWLSTSNCEQLRLKTRFDGTSLHDIYTKTTDDAVIDKAFTATLYESFLQHFNTLEKDEVIADFVPFAYDWRLQLNDLLKTQADSQTQEVRLDVTTPLSESHLYQTIQSMAENSRNGKVTIVAHSNGGLLAKTLMSALQSADDPLMDTIDNVILVASPQVGTPDAIVGMLQGSEIGGGYVVDQATARNLLNTAPFGHHLLPTEYYFEGSGTSVLTPVISFKAGSSTNDWRDAFGSEITDNQKLQQFLSSDSGRDKPASDDLSHPETVDTFLLEYAETISHVIEDWTPGTSTTVYQIAGTGIETPSGITYFTDKECVRGGYLWFECSEYAPKLGYSINFTLDGDGTVVVPSALAMSETDSVQRLWLDLNKFDREVRSRVHSNILEVPDVIDFITTTIQSTTSPDLRYLTDTRINPVSEKRLSFFLHSPLDMYLESSAGITSSTTDEIPGATYRRYGEVQYISMSAESTGLTLQLQGYESGSFTLVIQEWDGDVLVSNTDFQAIPTSASTSAFLSLDSLDENTELQIDVDSDGTVDGVVSVTADVVVPVNTPEAPVEVAPETVASPSSLSTGTRVESRQQILAPEGVVAGAAISADEQWYYGELLKILQEVEQILVLMENSHEK